MKVLFILYRGNPYCGGQGIYLYNLSRELAREGIDIDVIVGPPYPDPLDNWSTVYKVENLNIWSIKTKDIPLNKLKRIMSPLNFIDYILTRLHKFPEIETFSLRGFFLLKKILKNKRYDIIHDINTLGWGMLLMKGFKIPVISTIHHPLVKDMEIDLAMDKTLWDKITTILFYPLIMQRAVINRLDHIITSFKKGIDELDKDFGLSREKVSVVYNGMDINMFRNTGEKRESNSLLFVGNTEDHKKGLIYLLKALKMLPENISLTIVDDGPPKKLTASKQIADLGLENRIEFTGKVDHDTLVRLYSKKTIIVTPSLFEGFGLPAVEAMACNTPVVSTDAGALKEVVHEQCGITVPPKNPELIKNAILKLIKDKKLQKKMGREGRTWVKNNFAWEIAARNTLNVYREVIKKYRDNK